MEGEGDLKSAVLQGLTNKEDLIELICLLRAATPAGLNTEAFVAEEVVYTSVVEGRTRAVTLVREYKECKERLPEVPLLFSLSKDLVSKGQKTMFFEERDTRSSPDVLIRRHMKVPVSENFNHFLEFQGMTNRSTLYKEGFRVPIGENAIVTIFKIIHQAFPLSESDLLMVEVSSLVREGTVVDAIQAVRQAGAVLGSMIVPRKS